MKNYLLSIDNELRENYEKFITNSKDTKKSFELVAKSFSDDVTALLDYYITPMFTNGKSIIQKKLGFKIGKASLDTNDNDFIKNYKLNDLSDFNKRLKLAIINCYDNRINDNDFYNQLSEIIVSYCIKLFKLAQLIECKNNGFEYVKLISDYENSCAYCQTLSKFPQKVESLIKNIDELHPFCKLIINVDNSNTSTLNIGNINVINLPINLENQIKAIIRKLQIIVPDLISDKNFKFVDNISEDDSFILLLEKQFGPDRIKELNNLINNQIICFETDNEILISNKHLEQLDYIITKYLLKDKLNVNDESWWKEKYYERQKDKFIGDNVAVFANPFVTYEAEQNYESYFLESAIYYVINPQLIKNIDQEAYSKLKQCIFNNIEFTRG